MGLEGCRVPISTIPRSRFALWATRSGRDRAELGRDLVQQGHGIWALAVSLLMKGDDQCRAGVGLRQLQRQSSVPLAASKLRGSAVGGGQGIAVGVFEKKSRGPGVQVEHLSLSSAPVFKNAS
jgi:hypothetical protein